MYSHTRHGKTEAYSFLSKCFWGRIKQWCTKAFDTSEEIQFCKVFLLVGAVMKTRLTGWMWRWKGHVCAMWDKERATSMWSALHGLYGLLASRRPTVALLVQGQSPFGLLQIPSPSHWLPPPLLQLWCQSLHCSLQCWVSLALALLGGDVLAAGSPCSFNSEINPFAF